MVVQKTKPATKKLAAASKSKPAKAAATATAKKTAATKVAPLPAKKKAPVKKTATTKAKPAANKTTAKPTPEERYRMVETAAYFIAEHNGFQGCSTEHWTAAEIEIAAKLGQ